MTRTTGGLEEELLLLNTLTCIYMNSTNDLTYTWFGLEMSKSILGTSRYKIK
jgi:hypothetical protein